VKNHPIPNAQSTATHTTTASTFRPRVRRLGPGHYLVESATKPGTGHPVTLDRCNCPGFSYRGTCRHIALVRAIEPRMDAWYGQAAKPACTTVEEEHAGDTSIRGTTMVANTLLDAQTDAAEARLAQARRALHDADPRDDSYAVLWRQVDGLEREVAALHYSAIRAA